MPRAHLARCAWPRCPHKRPCPVHSARTTPLAPNTERGYTRQYRTERAALLADHPPCYWCGDTATTADHVPPLRTAATPADWTGVLVPACRPCQNRWIVERDGDRPA